MALTTAAGTKLPDLRVVPLADDMVFRESLDAQSRIFRGHHGVFDEHGAAHFEVHAPAGVELRGTELQLSLQILADHAYLGIETICAAQPIRL